MKVEFEPLSNFSSNRIRPDRFSPDRINTSNAAGDFIEEQAEAKAEEMAEKLLQRVWEGIKSCAPGSGGWKKMDSPDSKLNAACGQIPAKCDISGGGRSDKRKYRKCAKEYYKKQMQGGDSSGSTSPSSTPSINEGEKLKRACLAAGLPNDFCNRGEVFLSGFMNSFGINGPSTGHASFDTQLCGSNPTSSCLLEKGRNAQKKFKQEYDKITQGISDNSGLGSGSSTGASSSGSANTGSGASSPPKPSDNGGYDKFLGMNKTTGYIVAGVGAVVVVLGAVVLFKRLKK